MADGALSTFLRRLRGSLAADLAGGLRDGQLLERFVQQRDEAAFEALFWRHAPLVLSVCQRLLPESDVEDAFQATFLTLVRKAASVRRGDALAGWLHRVAYRIALRARARGVEHPRHDLPREGIAAPAGDEQLLWRDLRPLLDEEIDGLPEKYRRPVILCYLEGKTQDEAARELGCPRGTIGVRLMRACERLRRRLSRRGVALSAAVAGPLLSTQLQAATLPAPLAASTIRTALLCAAGQPLASVASPQATALAEGALRAMTLSKLKVAAMILVVLGTLGGGGAMVGRQMLAGAAPVPEANAADGDKRVRARPHKLVDVVSQREGQIVVIGTEIKPGEKVPAAQIVAVKLGSVEVKYRRLRAGDVVEAGQMVGRVDDQLARDDLRIREAKVKVAVAEVVTAEKTRDEAQKRQKTAEQLFARGAISFEESRAAQLTHARYEAEVAAKRGAVAVAQLEVEQAQTILDMHVIRTRLRGTITRIYKHPGEGIKALEPVLQIRIDE
jgi:RNA polymerase sigma factor (sigma-70 family)